MGNTGICAAHECCRQKTLNRVDSDQTLYIYLYGALS